MKATCHEGSKGDVKILRKMARLKKELMVADQFASHILDLLFDLGEVESTRFFGGTAIKLGGVQFAMVMRGVLYFVVDEPLREKFREMGSQPFSYQTKKGQQTIQRYYSVPEELLEAPHQLCAAANSAFAHALATSTRPGRTRKHH